jgi:hypothetical protein
LWLYIPNNPFFLFFPIVDVISHYSSYTINHYKKLSRLTTERNLSDHNYRSMFFKSLSLHYQSLLVTNEYNTQYSIFHYSFLYLLCRIYSIKFYRSSRYTVTIQQLKRNFFLILTHLLTMNIVGSDVNAFMEIDVYGRVKVT